MATDTLQLYWDLASLDPQARLQSAQSLIRVLARFQKDHEAKFDTLPDTIDTEEQLDAACAPDVSYAIRRLLRGLPSSRQGSRQGFSLALTELLAMTDKITLKLVLDLLFKFTERTNKMKGEEVRDRIFGRLFGLLSVIGAGMLARPSTTNADLEKIIDEVAQTSRAKDYLTEVSYYVVIHMLPFVKSNDEILNKIMQTFIRETVGNIDELSLVLALQQHAPQVDLSAQFKGWNSTNVLAESNVPILFDILKNASVSERDQKINWRPELHPVWDQLIATYLDTPQTNGHAKEESDRPKKKRRDSKGNGVASQASSDRTVSFAEFWLNVVDPALFADAAATGRIFWGFKLLAKVLPSLDENQVPIIFTPSFMKCFYKYLTHPESYLIKAAQYTARVIQRKGETNRKVALAIVLQLVGKNGHVNFDKATKTRLVENLVAQLDSENVQSYLEYLAKTFYEQQTSSNASAQREWVVSQMLYLIQNNHIPKEQEWLVRVARFVMTHAFFDVKKDAPSKPFFTNLHVPNPPLSPETREVCQRRFQDVLHYFAIVSPPAKVKEMGVNALKSRKLHGLADDGKPWVYHVFKVLGELLNDKNVKVDEYFTKECKAKYNEADKLLTELNQKLEKIENPTNSVEFGFALLVSYVGLNLLSEPSESTDTMTDLVQCYGLLFGKAKRGTKKAKQADDTPKPIDVVVDILISFLTNESPALRDAATRVFRIIAPHVTEDTLNNILNILTTDEDSEEAAELFEDDVDMDENEEDDEEEEEDEEESDDESDDEETGGDPELEAKLEAVMRQEGVLAEDDDADDMELDDDAMFAFDEKLAQVFKERKQEKERKYQRENDVVQFKNRVVELLHVFTQRDPENPLVLVIITPLLNLIRTAPAKSAFGQLQSKCISVLNKLAANTDYPRVREDYVFDILQSVHDFAANAKGRPLVDVSCKLSAYLRKCIATGRDMLLTSDELSAETKGDLERVAAIYDASMRRFFATNHPNTYQGELIRHFAMRYPLSTLSLADTLETLLKDGSIKKKYKQKMAQKWLQMYQTKKRKLKLEN